jgi:hypothetical protein
MIGMALFLLILSTAIPAYLSTLEPELFNSSPAVELYHFTEHGLVSICIVSSVVAVYSRNGAMRKIIFREMKDDFNNFKDWLTNLRLC